MPDDIDKPELENILTNFLCLLIVKGGCKQVNVTLAGLAQFGREYAGRIDIHPDGRVEAMVERYRLVKPNPSQTAAVTTPTLGKDTGDKFLWANLPWRRER